ncbi:MAG: hypothetical protein EOO28_29650 [Comamonadaceae bacterium]|nr:MAG: hypothetical protein EOO28_29650 [Comamonadaceae bacterium]
MQREQSAKTVLPGGMRLGFALQQAVNSDNPGASYSQIWLGDLASGALPQGVTLTTQGNGYAEAAARLGCLDWLSSVSAAVKSAAVAADTLKLAEQEVLFRELGVKGAEESLVNSKWRMANWTTGTAMLAYGMYVTYLQMGITPVAYAVSGTALAGYGLAISGLGIFLRQTAEGLIKTEHESLPAARLALKKAKVYRDSVRGLLERNVARANELQKAD